jgi:hypothetical protein
LEGEAGSVLEWSSVGERRVMPGRGVLEDEASSVLEGSSVGESSVLAERRILTGKMSFGGCGKLCRGGSSGGKAISVEERSSILAKRRILTGKTSPE